MKPEMGGTVQCHRYWDVPCGLYKARQGPSYITSPSTLTFLACLISHLPTRTFNLSEESVKVPRDMGLAVGGTLPSLSILLSLASETHSLHNDRNIIPGPIVNLDDYSLLNIFYLYRLTCLECDDNKAYISESISGGGGWAREHWWCKLVRVCRAWRHIIFGYHPTCAFASSIRVAHP